MLVVGLDLGGVETRPSGFCILNGLEAKTFLVFKDQEILRKIVEVNPQIVAIDAPLCLPPGRKTIYERTNVHLRQCDKELLRLGIKFFPITLGPMRKLTERGICLKQTLNDHGFTVIEVYPGGAQDVLGIPRKQKGIDNLRKGLENLGIIGLNAVVSDHELDAATCAYVGKLLLEGETVELGEHDQAIIMPKGLPQRK